MRNPFTKDFDEILDDFLTSYQNQFPGADISQGSLIFIKAACYSSLLWGAHKAIEWNGDQIFPDTADPENLYHHGFVRGIQPTYQETESAYLARVLDHIRRPPAGGNKYDYPKWAKEVNNVAEAYCFPTRWLGSVSVLILANIETTGSEIPTQDLLDAVKAHIVDLAPVTASVIRVFAPTVLTQPVAMSVMGDNVNKGQISSDISAYMRSLAPGSALVRSQLTSIAAVNGADDSAIAQPVANVVPSFFQMIRPGVISVT